jgi:hypothetical protein
MQLVDWLNSGLPRMGWAYRQRVTMLERAMLSLVGILRTLALLFTVVIVGAPAARSLAPGSSWAGLEKAVGGLWWPLVLAGIAASALLSSVLNDVDPP